MSRRSRSMVGVVIEPTLETALAVRADAVEQMVEKLRGGARAADVARRGVGEGNFKRVSVWGVDGSGGAVQQMDLEFSDDGSGTVVVDTGNGRRRGLDALDPALTQAVDYQARRMQREGLRPEVRYWFTDEVWAAGRADELYRRYEIGPASEPAWPPGCEPREMVRLQPGRDRGTLVRMHRAVPKKNR